MVVPRRNDLVLESVRRLMRMGATSNLLNLLQKQHPADLAQVFAELNERDCHAVFNVLVERNGKLAAEALSELGPEKGSLLLADRDGDRVVLVVTALTQEKGLVFRYANKLREAGAEVIGLVLNRPVEVHGGHMQRNLRTIAAYGSGSPAIHAAPTEATG